MTWKGLAYIVGIGVAATGLFAAVVFTGNAGTAQAQQPGVADGALERAIPRLSRPTRPEPSLRPGREVEVIFIGSSSCGAAGRKDLAQALDSLRAFMLADAARRDYGVYFTGVALDWQVAAGFKFLEPFGPFDEVSVGRNWLNSSAVRYVWRDVPGKPEIPQLVLIERTVELGAQAMVVGEDRLLERVMGADNIVTYVRGLASAGPAK